MVELADSSFSVCEGDSGEICVNLLNIPANGIACDISITLNFTAVTASML